MLAIVPIDGFREFAFMMVVGVLLETFVVRPLLIPALITLFGDSGAWPGRLHHGEAEEGIGSQSWMRAISSRRLKTLQATPPSLTS